MGIDGLRVPSAQARRGMGVKSPLDIGLKSLDFQGIQGVWKINPEIVPQVLEHTL
jgi:hypothetical protein